MGVTAVICEYNPFHSGHEKQLRLIKAARPDDAVICIMSRFFCQRGDAAVFTPEARAECALLAGADAVLSLPSDGVIKDAAGFAENGVLAAGAIGADTLCFGSEAGDIDAVMKAAEEQMSEAFLERLDGMMKSDITRSRASFLSELSGELGSNDILGVEYIKAIKKYGLSIRPETVKRDGGYYSDGSASAIREAILAGKGIYGVPGYAESAFNKEIGAGRVFSLDKAERAVLAVLRTADIGDIARFASVNGELAGIMIKAALSAQSLGELINASARKRYSKSRIRRAILSVMLRIRKNEDNAPAFLTLIGLSSGFSDRFSKIKKNSRIRIVSRISEAKAVDAAAYWKENRAAALYSLCGGDIGTAKDFITQRPIVI